MVKSNTCDINLLHKLFAYDPETGVVTRKIAAGRRVKAGQVVGSKKRDGYLSVGIEGRDFLLHRVIWAMHTGNWPDGKLIDHIDGDGLNNRIANLREATHQQNMRNVKVKERDLPRGVYRNGKSFQVRVQIDGSKRDFGTYATVEEAAAVAEQKRREFHGEFFNEQPYKGKQSCPEYTKIYAFTIPSSTSGWPSTLKLMTRGG